VYVCHNEEQRVSRESGMEEVNQCKLLITLLPLNPVEIKQAFAQQLPSYLILLMSLNPETGATATILLNRQHAKNG
jgi:hypothetical protein